MEGNAMKRMRLSGLALTGMLAAAAWTAHAEDIRIELPREAKVETIREEYRCGDREVSAQYINGGPVSLAVLVLGEELVVASNVIAASGAKYAGGQYVWWTKGEEATLYDLRKGEAAPGAACKPTR